MVRFLASLVPNRSKDLEERNLVWDTVVHCTVLLIQYFVNAEKTISYENPLLMQTERERRNSSRERLGKLSKLLKFKTITIERGNTKETQTQNQTQTNIIHPNHGLVNLTVLAPDLDF
jgi:hypothetical protein